MNIQEQVISNIRKSTNYNISFTKVENKQYFVVNDIMTTVYLNDSMFRHLDLVGSQHTLNMKSSIVKEISEVYIEALIPYLENK